jgi:hypothetical protein
MTESKLIRAIILFSVVFFSRHLFATNNSLHHLPEQKIIGTFNDAFLEDISGIPVLHLSGSPYEMGYQYGALAGDRVKTTLNVFKTLVEKNKDYRVVAKIAYPVLKRFFGKLFWFTMNKNHKQEILGMVDGAKSKKIRLSKYDIAFINSIIDLGGILKPLISIVDFNPESGSRDEAQAHSKALSILGLDWLPTNNCNSMAVWGPRTVEGKTFQTRNVDLSTGLGLEKVPLVIIYKPKNGVPYISAAFAGVIGVFTGMNAKGVGLGQIWAFSKKVQITTPWPLQIKDVFAKAHTAHEAATQFLNYKKWTYGSNFVFADATGDGYAAEVNAKEFELFASNDPKEDLALWQGESYAIRLPYAVLRGDVAISPKLRAEQTASNGPNGDPRVTSAYKKRYLGQAERILNYESQGILMGPDEAMQISKETAMRKQSLQTATYANNDRLIWVSYAELLPDGKVIQAYQKDYQLIPFADYLVDLVIHKDRTATINTNAWDINKNVADYEILVISKSKMTPYKDGVRLNDDDIVELRHKKSRRLIVRKTVKL